MREKTASVITGTKTGPLQCKLITQRQCVGTKFSHDNLTIYKHKSPGLGGRGGIKSQGFSCCQWTSICLDHITSVLEDFWARNPAPHSSFTASLLPIRATFSLNLNPFSLVLSSTQGAMLIVKFLAGDLYELKDNFK